MRALHRCVGVSLFVVWTIVFTGLLLELGVRAYFATRVNADVMLWGSEWYRQRLQHRYMRGQDVFLHENLQQGYSKYFPERNRNDVDANGRKIKVTINKRGFRGADYSLKAQSGSLRVLALGASSTFGFGNRDDETWPFLLEHLLRFRLAQAECGDFFSAQVINLGIPHLNTEQIAALFEAEGKEYQPDVVAIYTGYNNTSGLGVNPLLKKWSRYLLTVNFVRVAVAQRTEISAPVLRKETLARKHRYLDGLDRILTTAQYQAIEVLPITQQVRALPASVITKQKLSYADEVQVLENTLQSQGSLSVLQGKMLIHASLMDALRDWADSHQLKLVDAIEVLDEHRHLLTSYVHLSPLANHLIALAVADQIALRLDCPELATSTNQEQKK